MSRQEQSPANICEEQLGATMDHTFGEQTDVYRVGQKIFALFNHERNVLTVKTPPDEGAALRSTYSWAHPAYYMNKRHWTTLELAADISQNDLADLIGESHQLVFASLSKKVQTALRSGSSVA